MPVNRTSDGRWPLPLCGRAATGLFVTLLALFVSAGCEKIDGTVDPAGTPPHILSIAVSPDVFLLDTAATGGQVTLQTTVRVTVRNPAGGGSGPTTATAAISFPGSAAMLATAQLREESNLSGVRTFAAAIQFSVPRSSVGGVNVDVDVTGPNGLPGNAVTRQILLRRHNARPVLSNLSAPDTVVLPPGGSILIPMTVAASDSDGLADIREVFFRSLDSSNPTNKFFLLDNGNPANGDVSAGDGVYSIIVQLSESPTVRRTFRFAFQAADGVGDTSLTTIHRLTVQ